MWTAPITVAAPEAEPIELSAVKEFLRIDLDDATFDGELAIVITGVRDEVEQITGTRLISQQVELAADTFADLLRLPIGPVQQVLQIAYQDQAGVLQVIDPALYEVIGAGLERGIRATAGANWPNDARRAAGVIRVTAEAVYGPDGEDLPQSLRVAMLRAVKAEFEGALIALEPMLVNHRIWL